MTSDWILPADVAIKACVTCRVTKPLVGGFTWDFEQEDAHSAECCMCLIAGAS